METTTLDKTQEIEMKTMENVLVEGDLSKLTVPQRLSYYKNLCESMGLNPLSKPFGYIIINSRLTLYALKDCTEQLRKIHGVSITDQTIKYDGGLCVVTVKGMDRRGRQDVATGAVDIKGLSGEKQANAIMKAETKAKRRLTLSLVGLGMLDESEAYSVDDAKIVAEDVVFTKIGEKTATVPYETEKPKVEEAVLVPEPAEHIPADTAGPIVEPETPVVPNSEHEVESPTTHPGLSMNQPMIDLIVKQFEDAVTASVSKKEIEALYEDLKKTKLPGKTLMGCFSFKNARKQTPGVK